MIELGLFIAVIFIYVQYRKSKKTKPDPQFLSWREIGVLFVGTFLLQLSLRFFTEITFEDAFFYIINFVMVPVLNLLTKKRLSDEDKEKIKNDFPGFLLIIALIISAFSAILVYAIFD